MPAAMAVATSSGKMRLNLEILTAKLCCPMLPLHIVYAPDMEPRMRLPRGGKSFNGHTLWYVKTSPGGMIGCVDMMPAPRTVSFSPRHFSISHMRATTCTGSLPSL